MNLKIFALMLCVMPGVAYSASRSAAVDGGGARASRARGSGIMTTMNTSGAASVGGGVSSSHATSTAAANKSGAATGDDSTDTAGAPSASCRDAYRQCMDEFCLQDETDGERCICSNNYTAAQKLLNEIKAIQADADRLSTVETQRARLGAKAGKVMDDNAQAKAKTSVFDSGSDDDDDVSLDGDEQVGDDLYEMASAACAAQLAACGSRAEMEEQLYARQIVSDCKSYNSYLNDQKTYAEQNKSAAQLEVANARLEVLDQTDKYNRGECLLAYKACVADKGGCGVHFENCQDKDLLNRRANACENILDQCMAARTYVKQDWDAEVDTILTEASKYSENNKKMTCMAKIQLCLEESCSPQTNAACLTNVEVAAGVCPIVEECEELVPGIKQAVVVDQLSALKTKFCENDVEACLKEKCGANFTGPQCLGKKSSDIIALCPQNMFTTCQGESNYAVITSSILLQYDYKQLEGCTNHFSEKLGAVCGTDMSCLPDNKKVMALSKVLKDEDYVAYREEVKQEAADEVDAFFATFEQDQTIAACASAETPAGKNGVGKAVFNSAKMIAQIGAQNRALRQLETKMAELSRQQSVEEAEKLCYSTYRVEEKPTQTDDKKKKTHQTYSYIRSVAFEPSLRNCHVCRMQQVCETGGESKITSALKAGSGGLSAGMAAGSTISVGWGTAIGGIVGAVGTGVMGALSGGKETFCQEVESCEDVNM